MNRADIDGFRMDTYKIAGFLCDINHTLSKLPAEIAKILKEVKHTPAEPEIKNVVPTVQEPANTNLSQIARNFLDNAIDQNLETVPNLGPTGIQKLIAVDVSDTDGLIGEYFSCSRDPVKFITWLTDVVGIRNQEARGIADIFNRKFGRI